MSITLPYHFPAGPANPRNRRQPTPGAQIRVPLVDPPDVVTVEMELELGRIERDYPGHTGLQLEVFGLAREGQTEQLDHMPGLRLSNVEGSAQKVHLVEGAEAGRRYAVSRPASFSSGTLVHVSFESHWKTGALEQLVVSGSTAINLIANQVHPAGTPPTELVIGRAFEGDFPAGKGSPGAWAPLYGSTLHRFKLNGVDVFGAREPQEPEPPPVVVPPTGGDRESLARALEAFAANHRATALRLEEMADDIRKL